MGASGSTPEVTRDDVRTFFSRLEVQSAPQTPTEVADELDCTERTALRHMEALAECEELLTKQVDGSTKVWWQSKTSTTEASGDSGSPEFSAFVSAVQNYAIFMLEPDGTVASWNEGAERIKGYTKDEIVGEHFSTFYTERAIEDGVPDENLEIAVTEGRVEDEGWRVRADGSTFWGNVTITAVRDDNGRLQGFTKVTRDMTERREYEQRLQQEHDLVEQIFETTPIGIGVIDPDGGVTHANRRMLDLYGIGQTELSESNIRSVKMYDETGNEIPLDQRPVKRVLETGDSIVDFQCQVEFQTGDRRWLSINAAPLDDTEDLNQIVAAVDDITELKGRERQLRRERNQTEKLLRTAPVAIAVRDGDGETLIANRRAKESLGLSEQESIEASITGDEWVIHDADESRISPDEMPSAQVLRTEEAVSDKQLRIETSNNKKKEFRVTATPLFGPNGTIERVITVGKDVTELKQKERELERQKNELETELSDILGRISDAFYALDNEFRFTLVNERAEELLQHSQEELIGKNLWEVFPSSADIDEVWDAFHKARETQEATRYEVYYDTLEFWVEANIYPSESGLSVYFRDITSRKAREQALKKSNERLEQFSYAASHDLQEPLRMVSSYLQLIEKRYGDEIEEDGQEFLQFAVDGADRMRNMIQGLLAYSRVETQSDPLEPTDLETVFGDVREDLQLQIEESDADISVEALPRVQGDADQLRQVFQNLLENAIEYSGEDPPEITITAEREGEEWVISVSDEGIGIKPENTEHIFDIFQRLHTLDEYAGTGIGLALCQRIIERHTGEIWVESEPGEGATFSFTVPVSRE